MNLSTRMALAMVGLVLLTTAALGVLTYNNVATLIQPRALDRLYTHARLTAMVMDASLRGARADALSGQATNSLRDLLATPEGRKRIELRFAAELSGKPDYALLRLIGAADGGMELVRVDRKGPNGAIRIATPEQMSRRGDRGYVKSGLATPPNQIHISPVQLNKTENGLEVPHVPTLRVVAPLHMPAGEPYAVLVINVDLRPAIAKIRASVPGDREVFVVNEAGDYLVHPDREREFGFDLGKRHRIQDDFPAFAELLHSPDAQPRVIADRTGQRFGAGWEWVQLAGGPRVAVVEMNSYSALMNAGNAVNNSTLAGGAIAVLCAMLLAVGLARSLTRPLVQITRAVEGLARGEAAVVSPGGSSEISVLAEAFNRMSAETRRQTEALKTEIEERSRLDGVLNNTINNMVDPVLVADSRGQVILTNPAARAIFGTLSGIGPLNTTRSFERFYPDGTAMPVSESPLLRAFAGESVDNLEFMVQRNGAERRSYLIANARPIRNEKGELQGAVTVYHDITQAKKAQEALLESERMARAIVDTALDAFVQIDPFGSITEWSPHAETLFGWPRAEALGKNLGALIFAPERLDESRLAYLRFIDSIDHGGQGDRIETEAIRRDGSPIQIEVSMTALLCENGYITNAFMRDLSDRAIAEEQLRQSQKMESIGQLTGGIAHDFNNMLTVITGTIDILADAVADKPQLTAIARLISEAADRGAELTRHLLAFARKQPLQPCETNVNALLEDLQKLLRPTLGEQIEIEAVLQDGVWPIFVDRGQLDAALVNLAVNARDAMPNGGRLTLETCNVMLDYEFVKRIGEVEPGQYVMIAVSDSGIGIPMAIRDKVFEPFFTTKDVGKGTGLGLSMVYGFIKQSGGHVTIFSEVGEGTTLRIYLPRAKAEQAPVALPEPDTTAIGGAETILIVEDDAMVRNYVTAQLSRLGYTTLCAPNAAAALAISEDGVGFDLLFTDIVMPGKMNGVQLAAEMAKSRPELRVLFTSGYSDNAAMHNNRVDPDILLLTKPYRRSDLARMVRLALSATTPAQGGKRQAAG